MSVPRLPVRCSRSFLFYKVIRPRAPRGLTSRQLPNWKLHSSKETPNPDTSSVPETSRQTPGWDPRVAASNTQRFLQKQRDPRWPGATRKATVSLQFCMSHGILAHDSYSLLILCVLSYGAVLMLRWSLMYMNADEQQC